MRYHIESHKCAGNNEMGTKKIFSNPFDLIFVWDVLLMFLSVVLIRILHVCEVYMIYKTALYENLS